MAHKLPATTNAHDAGLVAAFLAADANYRAAFGATRALPDDATPADVIAADAVLAAARAAHDAAIDACEAAGLDLGLGE